MIHRRGPSPVSARSSPWTASREQHPRQGSAHRIFDGKVRVGDFGMVRLSRDRQISGAKTRHRQRISVVSEDMCQAEVIGVVGHIHTILGYRQIEEMKPHGALRLAAVG